MNQMQPVAPGYPVNLDLEQSFLGTLMMHNEVYVQVSELLRPEHFVEELHQRVFALAGDLIGNGKNATPITLKTFLGEVDIGGLTTVQYLARLAAASAPPSFALEYAQGIVDLSCRRELMRMAEDVNALAADSPVNRRAADLIDETMERLVTLREQIATSGEPDLSNRSVIDVLVQASFEALEGRSEPVMATKLKALDLLLGGGLREKRLYVLAGRPGAGKTVLKTALARRLVKGGFWVADFSLEIDRREAMARFLAAEMAPRRGSPTYSEITTGRLNAEQLDHLMEIRGRVDEYPMQIDETGGLSMAQIEARARRFKSKMERRGPRKGAILIDYLQLIKPGDRYRGKQVDELGEIVLAGKNMAKRLDCAVILFSQLNRGVENREDKRPHMADLRGSGNIEEHADFVGLLYRPSYYDAVNPKAGIDPDFDAAAAERLNHLEVIVDKNRLGGTGKITLYADVAKSVVDNLVMM